VDNPPVTGEVVAWVFDSPNSFVDLRDPVRTVVLPERGATPDYILDLPAGEYALIVFHDANKNGIMDKNFIGIPREWLGFSNRYWPEGPPTFARAAFRLEGDETKTFDVQLRSVFGKTGLLGVGVGVIAQTSPYRGSSHVIVQPIPVISYIGDRVQVLGPSANVGILKWRDLGFALTVQYRLAAYDEEDSPILRGMGDRNSTVMGGLAFQANLPAGIRMSAGFDQDLLGRVRGGTRKVGMNKSFQGGLFTLSPQVGWTWSTAELTNYEFGVSPEKALPDRPAYSPGTSLSFVCGLGLFIELPGAWRIVLNGKTAFLPSAVSESPLVDQSQLMSGFAAVTRLF